MKKLVRLLFVLVVLGAAVAAFAADNVTTTKHNLTAAGPGTIKLLTGTDQVCVFCHTPHGGSTSAPLWNRTATAAAFTMYSSPTLDMTIAGSPQGVSLSCLGCHDGTVAFDALLNQPGSGGGPPTGWTWAGGVSMMPAGITKVGPDLSNDHPISVTYDITKDPAFNAAASGKVGALPLYGTSKNQVECGTCHNPHDATNVPFLRATNAASALCKTCHIK